jgi:hypothetical protein
LPPWGYFRTFGQRWAGDREQGRSTASSKATAKEEAGPSLRSGCGMTNKIRIKIKDKVNRKVLRVAQDDILKTKARSKA